MRKTIQHEVNVTDYYPFGKTISERTWSVSKTRYDFNGKETDVESGYQDYGFRDYDVEIARFLQVDPLHGSYPFYTTYQFAGNMPIQFIDLDGAEPEKPGKPGDVDVAPDITDFESQGKEFGWTYFDDKEFSGWKRGEEVVKIEEPKFTLNPTMGDKKIELGLGFGGRGSTTLSSLSWLWDYFVPENGKQADLNLKKGLGKANSGLGGLGIFLGAADLYIAQNNVNEAKEKGYHNLNKESELTSKKIDVGISVTSTFASSILTNKWVVKVIPWAVKANPWVNAALFGYGVVDLGIQWGTGKSISNHITDYIYDTKNKGYQKVD